VAPSAKAAATVSEENGGSLLNGPKVFVNGGPGGASTPLKGTSVGPPWLML
jgi:hypothetical protein